MGGLAVSGSNVENRVSQLDNGMTSHLENTMLQTDSKLSQPTWSLEADRHVTKLVSVKGNSVFS